MLEPLPARQLYQVEQRRLAERHSSYWDARKLMRPGNEEPLYMNQDQPHNFPRGDSISVDKRVDK